MPEQQLPWSTPPAALSPPPPGQRNQAIDLMRAGCILWIVGFWHLLGYAESIDGYKNDITYRLTVVVLGLFVLISGYLIGRSRITNTAELWRFYRRRMIRIYPPYLAALLLFDLCGLLKPGQFVGAALLSASFSLEPPLTLWYISMIVVFYLLAPLLLLLVHSLAQRPWRWASNRLVVSAGIIGLNVLLGKLLDGVDSRLFLYFPSFVAGLVLAPALVEPRVSRRSIAFTALATVAATLFSFHHQARIDSSLNAIPLAVFAPLLTLLVCERWGRQLRLPPLVLAISTASFFMYLFHRPIFLLFTSHGFPSSAPLQLAVLLLLALPVIVAVSWKGQVLYDAAVRRLLPRPAPIAS
ncbi:MAG: acyltransferase [Cyanobium sp. CZS 48M]|nr:acyltransferase [Cyanobium sp. CZS48M]